MPAPASAISVLDHPPGSSGGGQPTGATDDPKPSLEATDIGQLCVVGFAGTDPLDVGVVALRRLAEAGRIGGVIFFSHNIVDPPQLRRLLDAMHGWSCPAPLLLMVDQEGGRVQRLRPERGFASWASAKRLGAASAAQAQAAFAGLAAQVAGLGFNVNLAPCVDLHADHSPIIGGLERSFGSEVTQVVERAGWVIAAHRATKVATAIKHFPGHGMARGDTHRGLTDVTDCHQPRELECFARLIAEHDVDMVMTSHLVHLGLDKGGGPVTFSQPMVTGMLREHMQFSGVIVSDDLYMGALAQAAGDMGQLVGRTLAAGHDLLVFSGNRAARGQGPSGLDPDAWALAGSLCEHIAACLDSGRIAHRQLARSWRRVAALKQRLAGPRPQAAAALPQAGATL